MCSCVTGNLFPTTNNVLQNRVYFHHLACVCVLFMCRVFGSVATSASHESFASDRINAPACMAQGKQNSRTRWNEVFCACAREFTRAQIAWQLAGSSRAGREAKTLCSERCNEFSPRVFFAYETHTGLLHWACTSPGHVRRTGQVRSAVCCVCAPSRTVYLTHR